MTDDLDDFTRKPTGQIAWPFVLVEGDTGAGKTAQALRLAASPRVGLTFAFGFGDAGTLDEYARLGPYRVVTLTGLYTDFLRKLDRVIAVPPFEGRPNVIVIDNAHLQWDSLKDWTTERAKNSNAGRRALAADPDAAITVASNYWNDANSRYRAIMRRLLSYDGIVVVTAQGKFAAKFKDGQIVEGQKEWIVEGNKTLVQEARVWVRLHASPRRAELIKVRSLDAGDAAGEPIPLELDDVRTGVGLLDPLIFDRIGAGGTFAVARGVEATNGVLVGDAKMQVVESLKARLGVDTDEAVPLAAAAWAASGLPTAKDDEVPLDAVDEVVTAALSIAAKQAAENATRAPARAAEPAPMDKVRADVWRERVLDATTTAELGEVWTAYAATVPEGTKASDAARDTTVGDEHAEATSLLDLFARAGEALKAGTRLRAPEPPTDDPGPDAPGGGAPAASDDPAPAAEPPADPAPTPEPERAAEPATVSEVTGGRADEPTAGQAWLDAKLGDLEPRDEATVRSVLDSERLDPDNPDHRDRIEELIVEARRMIAQRDGAVDTGGFGDASIDPFGDGTPGMVLDDAPAVQTTEGAVALLRGSLGAHGLDEEPPEKDPTDLGRDRPPERRPDRAHAGAAAARAELARAAGREGRDAAAS